MTIVILGNFSASLEGFRESLEDLFGEGREKHDFTIKRRYFTKIKILLMKSGKINEL